MTNPDNVGGLPELPEPLWRDTSGLGPGLFTADQMRAYGELCRAAPAGGDVTGLHPVTADLVARFATALAAKLAVAERKYGYSDGWASPDWMDECRAKLMEHIAKGDPRDVAAYCAFLWHHGESTAAIDSAPAGSGEVEGLDWETVDFLGHAFELDALAQHTESQTTQRIAESSSRLLKFANHHRALLRKLQQPAEEDAYVIEQMGRLLAEIAIIVNGPEPALTKWSYHDLPEKVRKLQQGADYVMVPREALRVEAHRLRYRATETCGLSPQTTDAGAQMVHTAEALEQLASQGQEGDHARD